MAHRNKFWLTRELCKEVPVGVKGGILSKHLKFRSRRFLLFIVEQYHSLVKKA
jgi:hypothetical protein